MYLAPTLTALVPFSAQYLKNKGGGNYGKRTYKSTIDIC